jgi:hypothetical protein
MHCMATLDQTNYGRESWSAALIGRRMGDHCTKLRQTRELPSFIGWQFCRASFATRLQNLLTIGSYFSMPLCTARCAPKVTQLMRLASV